MVSAKHRTSFALDQETIRLIQHLAAQWHVSQAEVVRRAVRVTAERERSSAVELQERLSNYQDAGWITAETADRYLSEISADRAGWERGGDRERDGRQRGGAS